MNRGFWAVVGAFLIWGLLPVYLKLLSSVPATQIVAHRLVWCCVFALIGLAVTGRLPDVLSALKATTLRLRLGCSATLISAVWLLYVWAVNHNHVIEASLGYFITPLVNVLLAVVILRERLTPWRWGSVLLAMGGVVWLTIQSESIPWIALGLAAAFSSYGLIRKTTPVDAVLGLAVETLLIAPVGLLYLQAMDVEGRGAFGHHGLALDLLLVGAGLVTAVPLALFSYGARRISYSTVGFIQYLQPTMQFALGTLVYKEPFGAGELTGFIIIWSALALYTLDGGRWGRRATPRSGPRPGSRR